MKKSVKSTITTIILLLILGGAVFGFYVIAKRTANERAKQNEEKKNQPTEIEAILDKNLGTSYPDTARAVVSFYGRIVSAIHNEKPTDEEVPKLMKQMRRLFDNELLAKNSEADQLEALKSEILEYTSLQRTIENFKIDSADNIEKWTYEEREYCRIYVNITIKEKSALGTLYEEFILRKEGEGILGKWKILGWRRVDKDGLPVN